MPCFQRRAREEERYRRLQKRRERERISSEVCSLIELKSEGLSLSLSSLAVAGLSPINISIILEELGFSRAVKVLFSPLFRADRGCQQKKFWLQGAFSRMV